MTTTHVHAKKERDQTCVRNSDTNRGQSPRSAMVEVKMRRRRKKWDFKKGGGSDELKLASGLPVNRSGKRGHRRKGKKNWTRQKGGGQSNTKEKSKPSGVECNLHHGHLFGKIQKTFKGQRGGCAEMSILQLWQIGKTPFFSGSLLHYEEGGTR